MIELTIHDLAFGGRGVARQDDFVWFVPYGLPGQKVRARIINKKKRYGEAAIDAVLESSPDQVEAPCPYFQICGGCQLQHLAYEKQVEAKTSQIREILQRIAGIRDVPIQPAIPAESIWGYRNKMEFTFSNRRWFPEGPMPGADNSFALGLHVPGRFDRVLDIDRCSIQSDRMNLVLQTIRQATQASGLPAYDIRTHEGVWRFLIIREGRRTGDIMVHLITSSQSDRVQEVIREISSRLASTVEGLTGFVHGISDKTAGVAYADSESVILGKPEITERLGNLTFTISPGAFFQTNTEQAERLFESVLRLAEVDQTQTVFDLYCGGGAIGLFLSPYVKRVVGIEVIASAVEDARRNAESNSITNAEFRLGDLRDALDDPTLEKPDLVVLDPPRGGTHPKTIQRLADMAPPKIVYVSCNPAILARDLAVLIPFYTIREIQPLDLFPHTGHIETVVALVRK
jgi:23S rRNA (uracil1939-C5)-methyltransferase